MIKNITYNCTRIDSNDPSSHNPFGNEKMNLLTINEITQADSRFKNACQCFDCGYRVNNEHLEFKHWNGCVFEDIDYKKWIYYWEDKDKTKIVDPNKILFNVTVYLTQKYMNNFMFSEMSRSGKGFHFMFYFNCDKTENNWYLYKATAVAMTKDAFKQCGYEHIINSENILGKDKVYDDCSFSPVQMIYITKNKMIENKMCDGELMYYPNLRVERINHAPKEVNDKIEIIYTNRSSNADWSINVEKFNVDSVEYLPHTERWKLFCSLSRIFKDEQLREEWERCAELLPEANNHNTYYYKTVPYKLDWNRKLTGNEYCDKELLEKFGYKVKFINNKKDESKKTYKKRIERVYLNEWGIPELR